MTTIDTSEAMAVLAEEHPTAVWHEPVDNTYQLLTLAGWRYILREFYAWLRDRGVLYTFEKGDCDDFAFVFRAYCLMRNWHSESNFGLPIWLHHYTTDTGIRHAINVVIYKDPPHLLLARGIEPQPHGDLFRLSDTERRTGTLLYG